MKKNEILQAVAIISGLSGAPNLQATSQEGAYLDQQLSLGEESTGIPAIFHDYALLDELIDVFAECHNPNWDGYEAKPVEFNTLFQAVKFIKAMPPILPKPSIGADPDGDLSLDWHETSDRTIMVSINSQGKLHFAALVGQSRFTGAEPFVGEWPRQLVDLIRQVANT